MEILRKVFSFFVDTIQTLLLAASVFLVIYIFLFRPFQVNGQSMYPTFHDGEYVLTNLISLKIGDPIRGDVIVFVSPTDAEKDFIKRVIGIAGDSIYLRDGSLYLNGKLLDESAYLKNSVKTYGGAFLHENETITVPDGEFFVIGDNRPYSSDSREWGFLKQKNIIGKSFFVYWPPNRTRLVKNPFNN